MDINIKIILFLFIIIPETPVVNKMIDTNKYPVVTYYPLNRLDFIDNLLVNPFATGGAGANDRCGAVHWRPRSIGSRRRPSTPHRNSNRSAPKAPNGQSVNRPGWARPGPARPGLLGGPPKRRLRRPYEAYSAPKGAYPPIGAQNRSRRQRLRRGPKVVWGQGCPFWSP
uniref:Uncharacterized protein n=1 Tax=Trichoplax adhaerens TaxID=10228 RepID=Q1AGX5_TRIAD|nr:hypothetical protein [Trichoplax adhaerens]ABF48513.1 unknown [Trichoplax adhaerens]